MRPAPSTAKIYILSLLTFGLYFVYWCSKSRKSINESAKQNLVPPTWQLFIPMLNYVWVWTYAGALETVSYGRIKATDTFSYFVIATGIFFLFPGGFQLAPSDIGRNTHELLVVGAIILVVAIEIMALGLAFFCDRIQNKINQVSPA